MCIYVGLKSTAVLTKTIYIIVQELDLPNLLPVKKLVKKPIRKLNLFKRKVIMSNVLLNFTRYSTYKE